jgi:hypothetical protein
LSAPLLATELLAALAPALARIGARWYLFGAQAVIVWGRPRFTGDVDVTVEIRDDQVQQLIAAMSAAGFDLRLPGEVDAFVARTRVLPFLYTPTRIPLDVVVAGPGLEQEFLERARPVQLGGVEVPVLSPEDLVITKVLAARPKDLDDVEGILRERGSELDLGRIRHVLGQLEQALAQGDLVPAFERALALATRGSAG